MHQAWPDQDLLYTYPSFITQVTKPHLSFVFGPHVLSCLGLATQDFSLALCNWRSGPVPAGPLRFTAAMLKGITGWYPIVDRARINKRPPRSSSWLLAGFSAGKGRKVGVQLLHTLFFFSRDRVSLCGSGCPGTHFVDQAGLELRNPPASASRVLGLKACATTPGCYCTLLLPVVELFRD